MKIIRCGMYNYQGMIKETNDIEEINEFIKNDGSDYTLENISSYEYKHSLDIRIDFEHGLSLFLTVEK